MKIVLEGNEALEYIEWKYSKENKEHTPGVIETMMGTTVKDLLDKVSIVKDSDHLSMQKKIADELDNTEADPKPVSDIISTQPPKKSTIVKEDKAVWSADDVNQLISFVNATGARNKLAHVQEKFPSKTLTQIKNKLNNMGIKVDRETKSLKWRV